MGNCLSVSDEEKKAIERNRKIERENYEAHMRAAMEIKLLLLGAGESGKSTVLKQMQLIHAKEGESVFTPTDLENVWAPRIRQNVLALVKALCDAAYDLDVVDEIECREAFDGLVEDERLSGMAQLVDQALLTELAPAIKTLWADPGIQKLWDRRSEFQVIESHYTYMQNLDTIAAEGFIPTEQDVVLCRMRTIGIVCTKLAINNNVFNIYDVGGQRNERRKWIHCFDDVTAVIFVAALSEFDQVLFEDSSQNRMVEAIDIFHEHLYNSWFKKSAMILFLNKKDLFGEKIKLKDVASVSEWSDFNGPKWSESDMDDEAFSQCNDAGIEYFLQKFLDPPPAKQNGRPTRHVFPHVTTATNKANVEAVFNACREFILRSSMEESGFLT